MFEIKNSQGQPAEVFLYGEIGWEVDATPFVRDLANLDVENLTLRINSPGGDVYSGLAIMNALRSHPAHVTAVVEGLAASAASFIAVGGADRVVMRKGAEMMVHDAMSFVGGNADEMQKAIVDLDRVSDNLAGIYAERAGGDPAEWRDAMRAETWYTAEEAVAAGLADAVEDGRPAKVAVDAHRAVVMNSFKYSGRRAAPPPPVNNAPMGQESKEANMADLKNLAQSLGIDEKVLRNFSQILNESIEVVTNVEVTYPADTKVVPTGRVRVSPVGEGDLPEGLAFSLGEVPEGWSAEINDSTGELTVVAPAVAPGESATFVVTAQGTGAATEFNVTVAVKSAAEEEEPPVDPVNPDTLGVDTAGQAGDTRTVDSDTYNELVAMAKLGVNAYHEGESRKREAEVDKWIKEGRINASLRAKAVKAMERDPEAARAVYGANPKNTIPRGEIGYGRDSSEGEDPEAAARRQKPNPFPKPSF